VAAVEPGPQTVALEDGEKLSYGSLIWATGGTPRRLTCAGHDLAKVHSVRNRADVDRMINELPEVARVVVVGGGYIGPRSSRGADEARQESGADRGDGPGACPRRCRADFTLL
jgi:NAD(P)H-nitrite reductase large subunit